jgi:CheY-like chemotaxis protein
MHALIIEQDAWIITMIEDALWDLGVITIHYAQSAEEAVAFARHTVPDLITAAVRLGESSGLDAVEAIRNGANIPVVYVTATAWEVRKRHPDAVIVQKPFHHADLKEALKAATGKA